MFMFIYVYVYVYGKHYSRLQKVRTKHTYMYIFSQKYVCVYVWFKVHDICKYYQYNYQILNINLILYGRLSALRLVI